jgi:hypothetical protein
LYFEPRGFNTGCGNDALPCGNDDDDNGAGNNGGDNDDVSFWQVFCLKHFSPWKLRIWPAKGKQIAGTFS